MMNGEIWWIDFQEPRSILEKKSRLSTELLNEIYSELFWVLER